MHRLFGTLITLLFVTGAIPASAQETNLVLRAGEHTDFTRLVLSLPEEVSWRLEPQEAYVDLIIDDASISIDVSRTFERIPRTRLRDIDAMPTGVRLFLGCPCPLRIVDGFASQIIVDIVSPGLGTQTTDPPLRPRPRPNKQFVTAGAKIQPTAESIATRAGLTLARALRSAGESEPEIGGGMLTGDPLLNLESTIDNGREAASQTQAQGLLQGLVRSISGAVSQGILSADPEFNGPVAPAASIPASAATHLRFETAPGRGVDDDVPQECAQALSARISDWSSPPPGAMQRDIWAMLYDALDRIDQDQAFQLTSDLLRAGLGAEARAVLGLLPEAELVNHLRALSYIMDLEQPPQHDGLVQFADCSDADTLWAFLADPEATLARSDTEPRIVRAVQSLSKALRTHLGPTIVQNLIRHEATETAGLVQASLRRTAPLTDYTVAKATPQLLSADPATVADLDADEWKDLDEAEFLMMLEHANARELGLPADALAEAITRQFALRRSALGRSFATATARALAQNDMFDQAFEIAMSPEADLDEETLAPLLDVLYARLATEADDTVFVTTVFKRRAWAQDLISAAIQTQLATRLNTLGFEREAQTLVFKAASAKRSDGVGIGPAQPRADDTLNAAQTQNAVPMRDAEAAGSTDETLDASATERGSVAEPLMPQTMLPGTDPDVGSAIAENGLLAQGRSELRQSAELRAQLFDLLGDQDGP